MTTLELEKRCGEALTSRENGGIFVGLYYDRKSEEVFVNYRDSRDGLEFTLDPPKDKALEVYNHPFCYMNSALNGKLVAA